MALTVGSRVGGYEVLSAIGAGGMGEVYRARDTKLNRDVALKVLPTDFALDPDRLARFKREAQVLASLDHPNVGGIYGFEDAEGLHALVLQLVEGPTLGDRIAQGPMAVDEALAIARQIAEALEAAHEKGIIHRDLKPANVKVREDGTVKVLDFGLAKLLEVNGPGEAGRAGGAGLAGARGNLSNSPTITTPAMTQLGVILGTAAYMSPEQAKGRPADKRSDIWAFGCVLYEMLTGRRAFEGDDVSDTLASVLKSNPDWIAWPNEAPPAIHVLVEGCLAKDTRVRVGDMSTVRFVLAEAARLGPRGIAARAADDRTPRSRWSSGTTLATAVFAAAALGAIVAWNLRPAAARPPVTRTLLKLSDEEGQLSQLGRQMIAISPDGTRIAHTANQRLWLRSVSDFDSRSIAGGTIGIHSPAFSPDGQSVAFYSGNTMKRVGVIGDAPLTLCRVDAPFGVAWDTSGILVGQGAKGIVRCSPSGGPADQLATVQRDEQAQGPQMLPDGRHLLFTIAKTDGSGDGAVAARWDRAQVVIQDLKSGQRQTVIKGGSDGRYVPSGHLLYAIGGVVLAVTFDLRTLATNGVATPVLEGVGRARTNASGAAHVAVSNGGTLLYVPGPVNPSSNLRQLALADRAGVVTPLKLPAGPYAHVRVSRDGKRLALGSDDGMEAIVWIYDLGETSAVRRLTLDGKNRFPIWSPNGERVAFQSDREGDLAIFTERVDGTGSVERLTKPDKGEAHVPGSWAPDGKSLAFTVSKERSLALWTVSLADKKMAPYGNVVSAEPIEPAFSPDGRWIAYSAAPPSTGVSPNRGVYVQPVPATGARYQAPKQQLDFQPVWSPDSRELFYVPSAASGRIAAVRVSTQSGVTFGAPEILPARVTAARTSNEPRAFDILPDGRFVGPIASGSDTLAAVELRLVLNWFEELKQRVPVK